MFAKMNGLLSAAAIPLLLLTCSCVSLPGPETGRLFVELTYQYDHLTSKGWRKAPPHVEQRRGTYWAVDAGGKKLYLTAAHVLGVNTRIAAIGEQSAVGPDRQVTVRSVSGRALMGTLAYPIREIGQIEGVPDVAFLAPAADVVADDLPPIRLSTAEPQKGERVTVWGYPGTTHQHHLEAVITETRSGFFILNRGIEPGYSGGLVVAPDGKAYGVAINTDAKDKQTTVMRLTAEHLGRVRWQPRAEVMNHPME